jgi:hypothetical protein
MTSNPVAKSFRVFWAKLDWIAEEEFEKTETCRKALRILGGGTAQGGWVDRRQPLD